MSRVQIDPKFNRLMRRLPDDIVEPVKAGIAARGQAVFDAAQPRIPVRTGKLRDSLGIKPANSGMAALVGFGSKEWPDLWRLAGWRAKFIEFGTKGSADRDIPPQPARPFLRPAFLETRQESLDAMKQVVATVLKNASSGS